MNPYTMEDLGEHEKDPRVTVTLCEKRYGGRPDLHITVELIHSSDDEWVIVQAIDEDGEMFPLDEDETNEAIALAQAGVDETGR